jgi:glutathione synthase/RimK-type ligase-like ATP-grasp enzyme
MKPTINSQLNTKVPKVLFITAAGTEFAMENNGIFVDKLNVRLKDKCQLVLQNFKNLSIEIIDEKLNAYVLSDKIELNSFEAVYFKSYFRHQEQAAAITDVVNEHGIKFYGHELSNYIPVHKLSQLTRLTRNKVRVPNTIYMPTECYVEHYSEIVRKLGKDFIFKAIDASQGEDNYIVNSRDQLKSIVNNNQDRYFIAQTFIPNQSDIRVIIIKNRIKLILERSRSSDDTHLNNTSQGASAKLIEIKSFDQRLKDIALKAAEAMGRDVAGVDIMLESGTNTPYVLEVNASPQIARGVFTKDKLDIFVDIFKELVQ